MEVSKELELTAKLHRLIDSQEGDFIQKLIAVETISCNTLLTELKVKVIRIDYKWFYMLMIVIYEYYCREYKELEESLDKEVKEGVIRRQLKIFSGEEIEAEEVIEYIGLRKKVVEKVKWLKEKREIVVRSC